MKLHIERRGKGKPLVFIHGFGFNRSVWYGLTEQLGDDYCCYLVDLPGFGDSPFSPFNIEELSDALASTGELPEQFSLCGWSMGGLVALKFTLDFPQRVSKLVSVASNPTFVAEEAWPGMEQALLCDFSKRLQTDFNKTMAEFLLLQFPAKNKDRQVYRTLKKSLCERPPDDRALSAGLTLLTDTKLHPKLPEIQVPHLACFGGLDRLVPSEVCDAMLMLKPGNLKTTVFEKAAHMPFVSHQQEFINQLREFLC